MDKKHCIPVSPVKKNSKKTQKLDDFYDDRVKELVLDGATFGEIIEISKKEKWNSVLMAMPVVTVPGLGTVKKEEIKKSRLTKEEKAKIIGGILKYLEKKPWSHKADIAKSMLFDRGRVLYQVTLLHKHGKIEARGNRFNRVYAIKGERAKPDI